MAHFVVDSDTIAAKSQQAHGHIERLSAEVNGMTATLTDLQGTWTGTASASFQELVADWRTTQQVVKNSLDDIGRALAQAGEAYDAAEAGVQAAFAGR